jgi:hypothetical protein
VSEHIVEFFGVELAVPSFELEFLQVCGVHWVLSPTALDAHPYGTELRKLGNCCLKWAAAVTN